MDGLRPDHRKLTTEQIRTRISELGPWFHNMPLKDVWTAPDHFLGDYPGVKWRRYADALPHDLRGKTVLDIGCNGGFFSLEMKRRGADRVLAIDFDEDYLAQARFAAEVEELDIEFRRMSVYDVAALGERFDIVFFIGVFYHLRHPLLALVSRSLPRFTGVPAIPLCSPGFVNVIPSCLPLHSPGANAVPIGEPRPVAMSYPAEAGYRPPLSSFASLLPVVTSLKYLP